MTDERDLCKELRAKRLAVWLRQLVLGDIGTDAMLEAAAREGEVGDGLRRTGAECDDGTAGDKADRGPRA